MTAFQLSRLRQPLTNTRYAEVERIGLGTLMIGAPSPCSARGSFTYRMGSRTVWSTTIPRTSHSTQFYICHTLFFLAGVLFVPAVIGLARLMHPAHPRPPFWGVVPTLPGFMGFMGYAAMDGMDYFSYVGWDGRGLDPAMMQKFIDDALPLTPS